MTTYIPGLAQALTIKSGRVKLVLWAKFPIFDQKNCGLPFQLE
jgi:hypothetical protein